MTDIQKFSLFFLRVAMGWLMFYAGITKILDPQWSAVGYLKGAKTFTGFYQWLAFPANLGWINIVNEWGLTLLGISLILGMGVRLSSILGVFLMMLYYFPILTFPHIGASSFIVDSHIIFALILVFFAVIKAGRFFGLGGWCVGLPICKRFPILQNILG